MTVSLQLRIGATNVMRLVGLKNTETGEEPTDALVTGTLFAPDGLPVPGVEDVVMPFVPAAGDQPAQYRYQIPDTVPLAKGRYSARVLAVLPNGDRRPFYGYVGAVP